MSQSSSFERNRRPRAKSLVQAPSAPARSPLSPHAVNVSASRDAKLKNESDEDDDRCEYERKRAKNVDENNAVLKSLGITSSSEMMAEGEQPPVSFGKYTSDEVASLTKAVEQQLVLVIHIEGVDWEDVATSAATGRSASALQAKWRELHAVVVPRSKRPARACDVPRNYADDHEGEPKRLTIAKPKIAKPKIAKPKIAKPKIAKPKIAKPKKPTPYAFKAGPHKASVRDAAGTRWRRKMLPKDKACTACDQVWPAGSVSAGACANSRQRCKESPSWSCCKHGFFA